MNDADKDKEVRQRHKNGFRARCYHAANEEDCSAKKSDYAYRYFSAQDVHEPCFRRTTDTARAHIGQTKPAPRDRICREMCIFAPERLTSTKLKIWKL